MITTSGRHHADLGVPLAKAMDAYRAGGRFIWEALVAEAHATRSLSSEALVRAASRIWLILDDFTDAMADAYREAVAERIVAQEHERSALVAALLEGRITENETLWEAAEMLRISRRGPFVVVAAEVPEAGRQAFPEMEARQRAAKQLFVHPNTVRQRMRRTAELTGCQLSAPRDVAKLCLALEAVRQQPH